MAIIIKEVKGTGESWTKRIGYWKFGGWKKSKYIFDKNNPRYINNNWSADSNLKRIILIISITNITIIIKGKGKRKGKGKGYII